MLVLVAALIAAAPAAAHGSRLDLRFRGQAIVPTGTTFHGTTVGGLSSIAYDSKRRVYGPNLRHGERSLVLVSDDHFAATQFTQFLLFAIS